MIARLTHLSRLGALALALTVLAGPALASDITGALEYVPGDFTTVIGVDLDGLRASSIYQAYEPQILAATGAQRELEQFAKETGFDAVKDIKSLVLAGPDALMRDEDKFILVVEAKYDAKRLLAYLDKTGLKLQTHGVGAAKVYLGPDGEGGFAFRGRYVIAGPKDLLERAVKTPAGHSALRGPLGKTLARFKGARSGFAVFGGGKNLHAIMGKQDPAFKDLAIAAMGLDLSKGLSLSLLGSFGKPAAASEIATTINRGLDEMRSDPELQEMGFDTYMAKAKAKAQGTDVLLSLSLSQHDVDGIMRTMRDMFDDGGGDDSDWK